MDEYIDDMAQVSLTGDDRQKSDDLQKIDDFELEDV